MQDLKNSTSPNALMLVQNLAAYGPLGAFHEGRVLVDGAREGAVSVLGGVLGLVGDIGSFGYEHITNTRLDRKNTFGTSDYLEDRFNKAHRTTTKYLTGRETETLNGSTLDSVIHGTGYWGINVASFFIPVAGEARIASAMGKFGQTAAGGWVASRMASLGAVGEIGGIGTAIVEGVEAGFGIGPGALPEPEEKKAPAAARSSASASHRAPAASARNRDDDTVGKRLTSTFNAVAESAPVRTLAHAAKTAFDVVTDPVGTARSVVSSVADTGMRAVSSSLKWATSWMP